MKKHYLFIVAALLLLVPFTNAQNVTEIWGVTSAGGTGGGVLFKTDANGANQQIMINDFLDYPGSNPQYTNLCEANGGKLYGMTSSGGTSNLGVLFEYNPTTNAYTSKIDFTGTVNGSSPYGSLVLAANGKLYGMTSTGGTSNLGVMFEYDPATSTYTKKIDFTGLANGSTPYGNLIQAANGKLYGMTSAGGTSGFGVLFEYDIVTSTYTKKVDFAGATTGRAPNGTLVQSSNNRLYGMTYQGGTNGLGVLFEYDPATSTYTKKVDFVAATNGSYPRGSLMKASGSKLYGMTTAGGANSVGVLFLYNSATNVFTKKIDFTGAGNGSTPNGTPALAANGKLYGVTYQGGTAGTGTLFEYDTTASTLTKKLDFTATANGTYPAGSMMACTNGKLYGMTYMGGTSNVGVLFEYTTATSTYLKKIDFGGAAKGKMPYGSLVLAANAKLYGMTYQGGTSNVGVLFEFDPATNLYTKKLDFLGAANGSYPSGSLVLAANNKLYGMTSLGGAIGSGVLFEYDPATNTYTKKIDFAGATNGSTPYGSLVLAANNKLYGMTNVGGTNGSGVLFEYDPATSTYTKKIDFAGATNGANPYGSLVLASNNKLYGMTYLGGTGNIGVMFEYDPATSTYTKKIDFAGAANGANPFGSLVSATNGKLYGMTNQGGTSALGVMFEYAYATSTYTKKIDFTGAANGSSPRGSLLQAANGKLYGMTNTGGTNGLGVLYEYNYTTSTYTKKIDFNVTNGSGPYYTHLLEVCVPQQVVALTPDRALCPGGNTSFTTKATGNSLSYQWQVDNGGGFVNLVNNAMYAEVTDDTLHVTGVLSTMNNYKYRCIVTSACPVKSIYSDTATLTVYPVYNNIDNHEICPGGSYVWRGTTYTTAGTWNANFLSYLGCDSTFTLNLSISPAFAYNENYSICNGSSYTWHGTTYTTAGTYHADYISHAGCDSTYTLNLTVKPTYAFSENHEICSGASYTWRGTTYTTAGTYVKHYTTVLGCDSAYTLNLAVNPVFNYTQNLSICVGDSLLWQGVYYKTAGTYHADYLTYKGCDSTYTLILTTNPIFSYSESHTVCGGTGYTWHGTTYTTAGIYNANYLTHHGCDSIYTLNFSLYPSYHDTLTDSICQGNYYLWQSMAYNTPGFYSVNFTTHHGCDSTLILNLKVNPKYAYTESQTICSGDSLLWQGAYRKTAGAHVANYLSHGCDSTYTLTLSFYTPTPVSFSGLNTFYCIYDAAATLTGSPTGGTFSGTGISGSTFDPNIAGAGTHDIIYSYTDANSCTYSDTNTVVVDLCIGINSINATNLSIYPNPSNGSFTLELDESARIEIFNAQGSLVYSESFEKGKHNLMLTMAEGVYLLKAGNGKQSKSMRVVIQK